MVVGCWYVLKIINCALIWAFNKNNLDVENKNDKVGNKEKVEIPSQENSNKSN